MKKENMTAMVYKFEDTTIYTITDRERMTVYKKNKEGTLLRYIFAVSAEDAGEIDIEALHDNGYFDD